MNAITTQYSVNKTQLLSDSFCADDFWNTSLLVDSSWPRLTSCFQHTVLVYTPFSFLWISLPFYLIALRYPKSPPLPVSCLCATKLMIASMLGVISAVIFISDIADEMRSQHISLAEYANYAIRFLSYAVMCLLLLYERKCHMTSTALPLTIWTTLVLCDVVPLYTMVMLKEYNVAILKFSLFAFLYGLEVLMLLLHLVADNYGLGELPPRTTPELTSSVFGQFVTAWMTRTIIRGWRRDLEEKDMFDLHPRDNTTTLLTKFEESWGQEVYKCRKKRLKQLYKIEKRAIATSSHQLHLTGNEKDFLVDNIENNSYNTLDLGKGKDQRKIHPSLLKVLLRISAFKLLVGLMLKLVADGLQILSPLILSLLISYSNHAADDYKWKGYGLAGLMLLSMIIRSFVYNRSFWHSQIIGMNLKTIIIAAVYRKALTMNNEAKKESTIGEIVSLMSVDCQRVQDCMNPFYLGLTAPLQVVGIVAIMYQFLGVSVFAGLAVLILTIPLNSYLSAMQQKLQRENLKAKDARLRLTNEAISGIKVLKLYAWELSFQDKVTAIRRSELKTLMKIAYINMMMTVCFYLVPFLVSLATFAMYVNISDDNVLDANKAFVSLSFFAILRVPLNLLSTVLSMAIQAVVSIGRVNKFLCTGDLSPDNISRNPNSEFPIAIDRGTFTWDRGESPTLRSINMKVSKGQLCAVVGQVGSGKSSLMSALLGEMEKLSGSASINGSVAYVPQQAWIQNATVRDNVLFGKTYNRRRYNRVIQACALERDFEILTAGDMTEIGEKGINLSGGQKQRISLARAVYSGADIYIFDDPLSAVDTHVGKHIFNKVLSHKGVLKGKTRVLVTHGVHWLPMVDNIFVIVDGSVAETGNYEKLMTNNGSFAQFLRTYLLDQNHGEDDDPDVRAMRAKILSDVETVTSDGLSSDTEGYRLPMPPPPPRKRNRSASTLGRKESIAYDSIYRSSVATAIFDDSNEDEEDDAKTTVMGRLVQEEKVEKGKVKHAVLYAYAKAAGICPLLVSFLVFFMYQGLMTFSNFWLASWSNDAILNNVTLRGTPEFNNKRNFYLIIFGLCGVGLGLSAILYNVIYWIRIVIAAKNLHLSMLMSVLRSPMSFFDTTPLGRIMNRFSRDIEVVDNTLPLIIRDVVNTFATVLLTILVITINTPLFLIMMGPILIFFWFVQSFYISTSRQLKRLESVTRSPIYSHFSETISGGPVIRAYGVVKRFMDESNFKIDRNQALYYGSIGANRWLGFNLDMVANLVIFGSALFAVITPGVDGSTIGLSVSYAIQASGAVIWMVRQMSDMETNIVSVERLKEYSELNSEAEWVVPHKRPNNSWPQQGEVEFNQYKTRYREGLDLVLKGVTCKFKAGEKIGIVGRTGAGKSSLALALFRLIEAAEGDIIIDGINLGEVGLHDVRSRLTILPQDPVLFFGNLRMNLDPLDQYTDDQLWMALTSAHLGDFAKSLPGGLEYMVGEEGQSLSVGQRQLVCLARALLKKTKVLILDEATAAVDMETDTLIQNTIRTEFVGCTIITIAHRLNTIMDYDRIMVLDAGDIKEFDTPAALLANTDTTFHAMAREAKLV